LSNATYDVYVYTKTLMFAQWLALTVFLIIVTPKKVDYNILRMNTIKAIPTKILIILISVAVLATIFEIMQGGYAHKGQIYSEGSIIIQIGFRAALVLLIVYTINLTEFSLNKNKFDINTVLYVGGFIFTLVLFSGERDLILRYLIITLFVYYLILCNRKLNKKVVLAGLISLLAIPVLNMFKYYGLTHQIRGSNSNFIINFFKSDFMAASKNLQIILLDECSKGYFGGSTLISAVFRSLNLGSLPFINNVSSLRWYNSTYFNQNRAGQGFSIVADGYVNFGFIGIVIVFIIVGLLVKIIYKKSNKNVYFFAYYVLSIPIFMYAIRADLANILSPLIKQNIVVMLIVAFISKLLRESSEKKFIRQTNRNKMGGQLWMIKRLK
jgi:oligosaccharide repeat unit polymerase